MLNGHKGAAKQEKNLCWGAATQVSAICSRSLRPNKAMSSGAANSKTSQLNCEHVAPARGARPWNSDAFVSDTTMAKWRRLYHESIAAVFARRLY
jgi:hypothetical protein